MLKFFRKIRQKFLQQNKVGGYLLYSLGEIFLVVIGILIALSINNWNETRKKIESERELIISLKKELILNSALLDSSLNHDKKYGTEAIHLLEKIDKDSLHFTIAEIAAAFAYGASYVHAPVLSDVVTKNSEVLVTQTSLIDDFRGLLQDYEEIKKAEYFLDELWNSRITDFLIDSGIPIQPGSFFSSRTITFADLTKSGRSKEQLISLILLKSTLLHARELKTENSLRNTKMLEQKLIGFN
jgi:hypothetical protein